MTGSSQLDRPSTTADDQDTTTAELSPEQRATDLLRELAESLQTWVDRVQDQLTQFEQRPEPDDATQMVPTRSLAVEADGDYSVETGEMHDGPPAHWLAHLAAAQAQSTEVANDEQPGPMAENQPPAATPVEQTQEPLMPSSTMQPTMTQLAKPTANPADTLVTIQRWIHTLQQETQSILPPVPLEPQLPLAAEPSHDEMATVTDKRDPTEAVDLDDTDKLKAMPVESNNPIPMLQFGTKHGVREPAPNVAASIQPHYDDDSSGLIPAHEDQRNRQDDNANKATARADLDPTPPPPFPARTELQSPLRFVSISSVSERAALATGTQLTPPQTRVQQRPDIEQRSEFATAEFDSGRIPQQWPALAEAESINMPKWPNTGNQSEPASAQWPDLPSLPTIPRTDVGSRTAESAAGYGSTRQQERWPTLLHRVEASPPVDQRTRYQQERRQRLDREQQGDRWNG